MASMYDPVNLKQPGPDKKIHGWINGTSEALCGWPVEAASVGVLGSAFPPMIGNVCEVCRKRIAG